MKYNNIYLQIVSRNLPDAMARMHGSKDFPNLNGTVKFYSTPFNGIIIEAELVGLPEAEKNITAPSFLGFHIHENGDCSDNFANTGSHYNPLNMPHPSHLGDLLPILNNNGYSYSMFYDDFLSIDKILGRSVVLHGMRDDFTSQPAGDSGPKIGCGVIEKY